MTKYTYYCIGRVACHAVLIRGIVLVFADWSSVTVSGIYPVWLTVS